MRYKTTRPILPTPASSVYTTRLLLRPIRSSDLTQYHAFRTVTDVMKWTSTGKVDSDLAATQAWLDRFLPPNDAVTFSFSVEERDNPGVIVGTLGCHHFQPTPELGYMFSPTVWGKGYATEAVAAWLHAWWALPRTEVEVEVEVGTENGNEAGVGVGVVGTDGDVATVPEVLKADAVETNLGSTRILARLGFVPVRHEMVDDWHRPGEKVKLTEYHLQRPQ